MDSQLTQFEAFLDHLPLADVLLTSLLCVAAVLQTVVPNYSIKKTWSPLGPFVKHEYTILISQYTNEL